MTSAEAEFTSIEICAGAGGQAIGLHAAGFKHLALVEIDSHAAATLRGNIESHSTWAWEQQHCDVLEMDVNDFRPDKHLAKKGSALQPRELDLLAAWSPVPPVLPCR